MVSGSYPRADDGTGGTNHEGTCLLRRSRDALRATTYEDLTDYCQQRVLEEGVISVDFTNTQIVTMRQLDPTFLEQTSQVDFFIPDGMPLIWCLNQQGAELKDRVYGPTFMRHCLTHCQPTSTHFFSVEAPRMPPKAEGKRPWLESKVAYRW